MRKVIEYFIKLIRRISISIAYKKFVYGNTIPIRVLWKGINKGEKNGISAIK